MRALPDANTERLVKRVQELRDQGFLILKDWAWVKNQACGCCLVLTDKGFACLSVSAEPPIPEPPPKRELA